MRAGILLLIILFGFRAFGMEGIVNLEQLLNEKNQTLEALKNELQAKENLLRSSRSSYYPTFNAVGGWKEDRIEDPNDREKGYFGYVDGRLNLFNGFKNVSISDQRNIEVQLAKIEYEQTKRELKQQLVDVASEMIYLHKLQHILIAEEKITKDQKAWAGKKVAAGLTSQVDNLEFNLREEEIRIQQRQIDQLHRESHQKLIQMLGTDISDEELDKIDFTIIDSLRATTNFDPDQNLEVQKANLQARLAEFEKKQARSDFLPSVDFIYSFGRLTPSEQAPLNFNESKYGIQVVIPLFSGFDTFYKNQAATSSITAQKARSKQSNLNAVSTFGALSGKMKELNDLYTINERKLDSAKKYFEMTVSEYKRGIKNSPDLVGATERWFTSQKRKYELLKDIELTKVKIDNLN